MKKILALSLLAFLFACDNDNEGEQVCTNKLWNLTQNSGSGSYFATYGPTQNQVGTIEVNAATYDYYIDQGNVTDGSVCWEGTKD
ncbi:hypothetical protein [Flavobacterium sp.]|uniref:hypothetical protein n=1 Tax=Flavobacterium sp. TaxID=239 RepID=UPI00120A649D|nr:hypothetical protein [Flavobacterium sp.]RZJ73337.1 MAG: hypothetical protein EOO49_03235 [Flavobacterium sp.]